MAFFLVSSNFSATSVDVEEHLYRLANDMGITVVTSSQVNIGFYLHSRCVRMCFVFFLFFLGVGGWGFFGWGGGGGVFGFGVGIDSWVLKH